MIDLRIESFGQDCLGNSTGYRVVSGYGARRITHGLYVADLYEHGSRDAAWADAERLLATLSPRRRNPKQAA